MAFTDGEVFNTAEPSFMLAVGANNYYEGDKTDLRYFKWLVWYAVHDEEGSENYYYEMHPCSKEDLELFYEPEPTSVQKVQKFKEKGGLFCFDWKSAAFDLYGTWRSDVRMSAVDIMMVPCGTQY